MHVGNVLSFELKD